MINQCLPCRTKANNIYNHRKLSVLNEHDPRDTKLLHVKVELGIDAWVFRYCS